MEDPAPPSSEPPPSSDGNEPPSPHTAGRIAVETRGFYSADSAVRAALLPRRADESATRAQRLLRITAAIADSVSGAEVFAALVDDVAEAVDASSAALWLTDDRTNSVSLERSIGFSESTQQQFRSLPLDLDPSIPAIDAIRHQEAIWLSSQAEMLDRYPHLAGVATAGRAYRVSCLPLTSRGRAVGCLSLTIDETHKESGDERDLLLLVARYASQAIERVRLYEVERASRAQADMVARRLDVLNRTARAFVASDLDRESRLRAVARELADALASCINIGLIGRDGLLHLTAVHHPVPEAQDLLVALSKEAPIRIGEGVTGSIAATGESVLLPRLDPELVAARSAPRYRAFLARFPAHAMIGAALRVHGRVIGTVTATRFRPGETYARDDLRLLEDLADRAAVAIENSRLYQETADARTRAEQLYRFAQAVVGAEGVELVFTAALDAIETALHAQRASILTFDDAGVMRFRAWRNLSDGYRAAVEGHSPWSRDTTAPEPIVVTHALSDPTMSSYTEQFEREGIGALAFFPLVNQGRLLGKFMVYFDQAHHFEPHEIETARSLGNHLASVIARFAAISQLQETLRLNELFAGVLAHDLRNPLNAIASAAQLALLRSQRDPTTTARSATPIGRIIASSQRMNTMIDQLLDFTRARIGGGIPIQPRETNLADVYMQAASEIELAHPDWKLRHAFAGDLSGTWDPDRLLQVFSNLVANAGEHGSREGGVEVRLDGTDRDRVVVEVHNMGTIPASLLSALFDPFRGTDVRRRESQGLGLGLFIVREIVRAHGGRVSASSSHAEGTLFAVELPRHPP